MYKQNHRSIKKVKKIKIFLVLFLIIGIFFIFKYFNKSSPESTENNGVFATSTSVETKPQPIPIEPYLSIYPDLTRQGDPALIIAEGVVSTSTIRSFTFDNRPLIPFIYKGRVTALMGVDLYSLTGIFPVELTLKDGRKIKNDLSIVKRVDERKPFDIPEKLGGNSPQSIKNLISTLAQEGKIINSIPTINKKLWTEKFRSPLDIPLVVSDVYGYTRVISNFTMPHKGVDLEAPIGTNVYSMNRGVVGFTGNLRNYGNTIDVDHGAGLHTVYMHLSEIKVISGQDVEKGQLIGLSGDTGYVLDPHLHLTVRIWDISIDPIKFLEILGEI